MTDQEPSMLDSEALTALPMAPVTFSMNYMYVELVLLAATVL